MATNNSINMPTAAAGKIWRAQGIGTNSAFSTATYPDTAGTSGNVLTSDGTNWVSSTAPGAGISSATVVLTSAQMKALNSTPVTIVPAQGAGKVIVIISVLSKMTYGGTNAFSGGADVSLRYGTGTGTGAQSQVGTTAQINATSNRYLRQAQIDMASAAATSLENQPIVAFSAANFAGNAAGDNTFTITVNYSVASI